MKKTRSNTTMIEQTHNQVPQEPTTDSTVAASLRTLTLCLDQLLNRESEETINYDGDEPAAHFFSQLESQPNFHNLEPARQARKALSSLRGEPRKIAQDLALLNKTYEEVKESLCAVYPRRPSFTLQEFYELKCTSMAEIETYYKNKVRIGLAINLPKSAIVQALSNGVPRNYGNLLKMAQPSGPEEWLCLAQQLTYEGDNTSTKAAQQRSPRQSRTPSTTVDKTPPYPCRYCGGQHWHAQCQQRGPYQRTFRTFTPAVHSVEQPQRSTGPAGVYETAATTSSGETNIRLRALRSYERNYTISELECLAIVECVDKFRVYLLGTRFVIYSDHHALQWLKTIKDPTGRLFRWSLRLSAYDYEVKYLKGSRQYEADLLSRNPFCGFLSTGQIKDHQGELRRDTRYILNDKDLMTIIRRGVTKIIVPPSLRGTLLQRAHRDFNHPGISQMTRLIAAQYYWDGMTNDIRTHVRTCSVCQLVKPPKGPIYGELGQLPPAVLPYELVSLDTISGFAKYGNSQTCLHVVVDHATRTISRRLVANGLHSCRPLRRLSLTPPNRRQRLEWCRARSTWMTEWHRVVFSDESRFCLSSDSRRVRVWRRRGERSNPAAIVERPTVRQRGIMVWGAIAYDSRSPLLRIQGTMTAQRYVDDVLRPVTLPYLQGVPNALYQQDNTRPHTARISQQALQDVQMLPWPPYSPDLSPIEHVWDIIGRRLHALPQPRSEDEL
ncbi:K02A2.6-like [Cordylochernes scorpioides]|uniref:RNA-directed DNA polymerase n=1 Tax=Cordylochernes scorpioides TaxID=51811 RepID=A0ABY6KSG9_9ARAC|nr:K02A2.6-like [Cordylochernes scorpioides]